MRRLLALLLLVLLAGCGDGEGPIESRVRAQTEELREQVRARVQSRIEEARKEARRVGEDLAARVQAALEDLEQAVPRAGPGTLPPTVGEDGRPQEIDAFLTRVLQDVDGYWTRTFEASGIPEPRVRYVWVPPNRFARSDCGEAADDRAAFYCPADDTIYVGTRIAAEVYAGVARGFPGQEAGRGRAAGDFGVAYLVAHEYAHQVQDELGFFSRERRGDQARPFELQADCMAGLWGSSVFRAGQVDEADVQEALQTALAVGDFEVGSQQHHGTPEERRDAWLLGFESGDPRSCSAFIRA
jgi:uncharacterized protein